MKKRIICCLLVLSMLLSVPYAVNAAAAEPIIPLYDNASSASAILSISGNTATGEGTIKGYSNVTKIDIALTFQKKSLLWWSDVETWYKYAVGNSSNISANMTLTGSGTYRVKIVYKVYVGSEYETITCYSAQKTY